MKSKTFSNKISELLQNFPKRKFFFPKFFHVNQEKPIPKKWSMVNFNFFFHLNFFIFHFRKFSHFLFGGRKKEKFSNWNLFLGRKISYRIERKIGGKTFEVNFVVGVNIWKCEIIDSVMSLWSIFSRWWKNRFCFDGIFFFWRIFRVKIGDLKRIWESFDWSICWILFKTIFYRLKLKTEDLKVFKEENYA